MEFLDYATEHNIIIFRLPPHSTHLTQPLDVGCFQSFKHHHAEAVDSSVRLGNSQFGKSDFLKVFQQMHNKTFTKSTIISSFRHTGLVPFNLAIVVDKVKEQQLSQTMWAKTPPQPILKLYANTPRTTKDVIQHGEVLQLAIDQIGLHPNVQSFVERFVKGALTTAHTADLSEKELQEAKSSAIEKAARARLPKRIAQKGGVLTAHGLRSMTRQVVRDEEAYARRVIVQADEKHAREAAKIAERQAIDARKAARKAKKQAKDLAASEKRAAREALRSR